MPRVDQVARRRTRRRPTASRRGRAGRSRPSALPRRARGTAVATRSRRSTRARSSPRRRAARPGRPANAPPKRPGSASTMPHAIATDARSSTSSMRRSQREPVGPAPPTTWRLARAADLVRVDGGGRAHTGDPVVDCRACDGPSGGRVEPTAAWPPCRATAVAPPWPGAARPLLASSCRPHASQTSPDGYVRVLSAPVQGPPTCPRSTPRSPPRSGDAAHSALPSPPLPVADTSFRAAPPEMLPSR